MSFSVHVSPHISPHFSAPHISPHFSEPHVSPHVSEPVIPHFYSEPVHPSVPPTWLWVVHPHDNNGTVSTVCDDGSDYCNHYATSGSDLVFYGVMTGIVFFFIALLAMSLKSP